MQKQFYRFWIHGNSTMHYGYFANDHELRKWIVEQYNDPKSYGFQPLN